MKPQELEAFVKKMRELGVTEAEGIKLGAPPVARAPAPTPSELKERALRAEERERDVLFASSHVKPALRSVK